MVKKRLGILGGMGPEASSVLYEKITINTAAACDRDHLDIVIWSHASIPDRTEAILSGQTDEIRRILKEDAELLKNAGCDYLVVPCNTSHYFRDIFKDVFGECFIDMIEETALTAQRRKVRKAGVLGTDGTVHADLYGIALRSRGIETVYPEKEDQKAIMRIIYDQIKKGQRGSLDDFQAVTKHMKEAGCDAVILACTELSVLKIRYRLDSSFHIDAMDAVTRAAVRACGGEYKGIL
ncbi:MAG: amino acid racemase [Solobacterium sp.]|nr:amino acid racemase [Solobacterium sp.]